MHSEKKLVGSPASTILLMVAGGTVINCLIFGVYRFLFLARCGGLVGSTDPSHVLTSGLRLDLALLGFELCGIGLFTLAFRRLRTRRIFGCLWALAAIHAFICLANYFSFAERNQNAGDLLLPYVTAPYQVYLAVLPFVQQHWLLLLGAGLGAAVYFWVGVRLARRLEAGLAPVDLWKNRKTLTLAFVLALLPLMLTWELTTKRKLTAGEVGFTPVFANSKFYTHFADYRQNEAVINPLLEFVGTQIPSVVHQSIRYRLTEDEALEEWQEYDGPQPNTRYPLMKSISGQAESPIQNVIIIQVEGLSGSVLDQERKGRPVTPFLRRLTKEGLYFPNAFQNANFTSGGVFSTAASVPKATWEEPTRRFAGHEMHGYYGSLARTLGGSNYTHYFCEGFRQSGDDFLAFMAYQGNKALGYEMFRNSLAAKHQLAEADSLLGIHDGYMMDEVAEMLIQCQTRFTAHLMTCTTHSPWTVPPSFGAPFAEPELNTFAYLDNSINNFVTRIQQNPKLRENTLVVVLGDHTSVRFGTDLLERFRIPLIFYGPGVPHLEQPEKIWASQVDVLPTILGLMRGPHSYAGMGRNLVDPTWPLTGIVSGTRDTGYFLTPKWVLHYNPFGGDTEMYAVANGVANTENVGDSNEKNAKKMRHLKKLCFTRIELARRLSKDRRLYPLAADTTLLKTIAN